MEIVVRGEMLVAKKAGKVNETITRYLTGTNCDLVLACTSSGRRTLQITSNLLRRCGIRILALRTSVSSQGSVGGVRSFLAKYSVHLSTIVFGTNLAYHSSFRSLSVMR